MGGIVKTVFGGSSNKNSSSSQQESVSNSQSSSQQESGNRAFDELSGLLSGNVGQGNSAMSTIANLLGVGGGDSSGAFNNYLDSTGYQHMMDSGSKAITGNAASRGLLNSGSTLKGLTSFGQNLGKQSFNDYLGQLTGLGNYGLNSAGIISGAGNYSTGSSQATSSSRSTGSSQATGKGSSNTGIINSLFG